MLLWRSNKMSVPVHWQRFPRNQKLWPIKGCSCCLYTLPAVVLMIDGHIHVNLPTMAHTHNWQRSFSWWGVTVQSTHQPNQCTERDTCPKYQAPFSWRGMKIPLPHPPTLSHIWGTHTTFAVIIHLLVMYDHTYTPTLSLVTSSDTPNRLTIKCLTTFTFMKTPNILTWSFQEGAPAHPQCVTPSCSCQHRTCIWKWIFLWLHLQTKTIFHQKWRVM